MNFGQKDIVTQRKSYLRAWRVRCTKSVTDAQSIVSSNMARYRKVEEKVLTKWEYNGDEDNEELSFYANEIITVKDKLLGQPEYEGTMRILLH